MRGRPFFVCAGVGVGIALFLSGCKDDVVVEQPPPPPAEVEIVQPVSADIPLEYTFVGRTESSQRVEIRSRVSGFLEEIAYEEGGFVEEGELLYRIDRAPFESRLRAAHAQLAQQQARLDNAEALLARIEPLAEADAVSAKELDDARGRVNEAAAAVEAAKASVFDAELNLGYTEILAPVSGLAGSSQEREGAYISGTVGALTYVAKIDPVWVEFSISETLILRGAREQRAQRVRFPEDDNFEIALILPDDTEHPETGRISFADASVSTATGTVLFRAEIPNSGQTLRPGQYVRVVARGAVRPGAIVVPQRAVRQGPKGPYVWLVGRDGNAEQRPVALGDWYGDGWIIESGVTDGDRVIVNGAAMLAPGRPVAVGRVLDFEPSLEHATAEDEAEAGR